MSALCFVRVIKSTDELKLNFKNSLNESRGKIPFYFKYNGKYVEVASQNENKSKRFSVASSLATMIYSEVFN